jgi:tetratricopeptide (TPR) repeat protein
MIAIPALLFVFSLTKGVSQNILLAGERSKDIDAAVKKFDLAGSLDPANPGAELAAAESLARRNRWSEAVPYFRRAIDGGLGVTVIYSYQANAQEMAGDLEGAETTLRQAASIFPRSCFVRARLALVLEKVGKDVEAEDQLRIGRAFDLRQTNGWYSVIKDGILNAHLKSQSDPENFAAPPELLPYNAIHAYNTDKVRVD